MLKGLSKTLLLMSYLNMSMYAGMLLGAEFYGPAVFYAILGLLSGLGYDYLNSKK